VTVVLSSFGLWKLGEYILWLFKGMGENIEDVNAILIYFFFGFWAFSNFPAGEERVGSYVEIEFGFGFGL